MSNKRKLENTTSEPKNFIILHDLFSFSAFSIELHCTGNCKLEGCKLEKFSSELDILVKEQHEKANFIDLCNAYPETFSTFYSYSLKENY